MAKLKVMLIFLSWLIATQTLLAQNTTRNERRGDRLYESMAYKGAIDQYLKAIRKEEDNPSIKLKLAECYRKINHPDQSVEWFKQGIISMAVTPDHKLHYAQVLQRTGDYDLAKTWTEQYLKERPNDKVALHMLNSLKHIEMYYQDSAVFTVEPLSINTPAIEFGPAYYKDGIVFASSRGKETARRKSAWDGTNFLDLYYAKIENHGFQEPIAFTKKVNSKYHEGPATFFDQSQKMIFTRNSFHKGRTNRSSEGVNNLKMFYAENYTSGNNWVNIIKLPFNNDEYSIGHPSMDEEGTTLFFASNMPGGYGGSDIYRSIFVRGKWDTPINLGPDINTSGDEMFPFNHQDKTLYFASNGYGGLGGMDIFSAELTADGNFETPTNIGAPVNSSRDDFALVLDAEGTKGFFSSQRSGNDDIYAIEILRAKVEVLASDSKFNGPVDSVEIRVYDGNILVASMFSDSEGKATFDGAMGKDYIVKAYKDGYVQNEQEISTVGKRTVQTAVVIEQDGPDFTQADLIVLKQNGEEKIYLANQDQVLELVQEADGSYLTDGSQHIVLQGLDETLKGSKDGQNQLVDLMAQNQINIDETFSINPIYYNFDRSSIRKDALEEMGRMIALLDKHQFLEIEMSSHTDSRGSNSYNEQLSQLRAEAAVKYLEENGIERKRLRAKGYGETMLVNQCANKASCDATGHQANRRTEFRILGIRSPDDLASP